MSILDKKRELRKNILKIRREIDLKEKNEFDKIIENKFYESAFYKHSKNLFIYISYESEIETKDIIKKALKDGKNIYIPRIEDDTKVMDVVKIVSLDNLVENKYGILEPAKDELAVDPNEFDLIIMPGVAFDKTGGRMGYGAGYYDKYLKKIVKPVSKVAFAYDFQVINEVPIDSHDIPINYILTERENIECGKKL
ncbi:5-formyltetrahydrofolate cyclo-ligase [Clostridium uliginosum]|uniref:5-formyltetrahydrofolate cyclo-ligase n=1 Tax=Clostridium uliginosum TaxID=119641 RepID=A0A1I1J0N2_9CLOT|nr:5-formyltetrahydrofolate cyclo-ligase [Clostridium uliginosum]SFC42129.1 5-formyltetrahydrofolate cyclo-ligase [Clostridium uliginosum]